MNAIILAAGLGTRFKEWTKENHKSLFPIQDIPNIERTICYLIEADITSIYIVTGHMSEKFLYLSKSYKQVKLIHNFNYANYNSIYTFSLVLPYFSNSWVIDADTVLTENIFKDNPQMSTYYTVLRNLTTIEWCPTLIDDKIVDILITDDTLPSLSGISYWHNNECNVIKNVYKKYMNEQYLLNSKLYWDDIVRENISSLNITAVKVPNYWIFEMDTQEEYFEIVKFLKNDGVAVTCKEQSN